MEHVPAPGLDSLIQHNRDLEAQLQEAAEREEQLKRCVGTLERALTDATEKSERREAGDEVCEGAMESTREELQGLRRRIRYYEDNGGEELLLFVARRQLGAWDAKTQRSVLLATKATYAELLPLVTRAVLAPTRPCSFAGVIGLRELTLRLHTGSGSAYAHDDLANWSHLTGLSLLKIGPNDDDQELSLPFPFPASLSNLASLSELHLDKLSLTGLHHLSALSRLASLHVIECNLEINWALPVLPSLQALHVEGYDIPETRQLARQRNLTKVHLVGGFVDVGDDYIMFSDVGELEHLAVLTGLQELVLCDCLCSRSLSPVTALTALTQLSLQWAWGISSLQPLTTLVQLRVLGLSRALRGWDLGPLTHLSSLEHLDISYCSNTLDVTPLTALSGLKTVNIAGCNVQNEETLAGMQQLTVIG